MQNPNENNFTLFQYWENIFLDIYEQLVEIKASKEVVDNFLALNKQILNVFESGGETSREEVTLLASHLSHLNDFLSNHGLSNHANQLTPLREPLEITLAKYSIDPMEKVYLPTLPSEIVVNEIAPYLPFHSLMNLASTCTFFCSDNTLRHLIQDKRPKYKVATGGSHTLILHYDGSVFGFGSNTFGQLGLGHTNDQSTPQPLILPEGKKPIKISLGFCHSFILCEDGSLFGFGANDFGQLGLGHTNDQSTPQPLILPEGKKPKQISLGTNHSFILCEDGSLFGFGKNDYGQLGLGYTNNQLTPQCLILPKEDTELNNPEKGKPGGCLVMKK
jgi:hypothetical protein